VERKQILSKEKTEDAAFEDSTLFVPSVEDFFLKKKEPLVTPMTGPVPLLRVSLSGTIAFEAKPRLCLPLCL